MQSQVRHEYNNTALPRNATNSSVLRTTAFWDAMQIKVLFTATEPRLSVSISEKGALLTCRVSTQPVIGRREERDRIATSIS